MSRLKELLELKNITTEEQKKEVEFFIGYLADTNIDDMKEQYELENEVNALKEDLEQKASNPFRNPEVARIYNKIIKIDYKNDIRYQNCIKLKKLLNQEVNVN